jgi:hypothetical protein
MLAITLIITGLLQAGFITRLYPSYGNMQIVLINMLGLFNGQFLFVLKFFGEVLLIFLVGGLIGKLLHLDKDDNSDSHAQS